MGGRILGALFSGDAGWRGPGMVHSRAGFARHQPDATTNEWTIHKRQQQDRGPCGKWQRAILFPLSVPYYLASNFDSIFSALKKQSHLWHFHAITYPHPKHCSNTNSSDLFQVFTFNTIVVTKLMFYRAHKNRSRSNPPCSLPFIMITSPLIFSTSFLCQFHIAFNSTIFLSKVYLPPR